MFASSYARRPFLARRGFTLVEMIVVVAIFGLIAAIVVPRVFVMRDQARGSETRSRIVAAASSARELARSRGERVVVGLDPTGGAVTIASADEEREDRLDRSVPVPGPFTVTSVDRTQTVGQETTAVSGETLTVFFEDGTAEPSTAELTIEDRSQSLRVGGDGRVTIGADLAPEPENDKWSAGELENRA